MNRFVVLIFSLLLMSACELFLTEDKEDWDDAIPITMVPTGEFETYYENMPKDSVTILSSRIDDNVLRIEIQYQGGCGDHEFELLASNMLYTSNPPQLPVYLGHSNGNDPCEEVQVETLFFDLKPLRQKWFSDDYGKMEALVIRLNDEPMDNWLTDRSMWLIR